MRMYVGRHLVVMHNLASEETASGQDEDPDYGPEDFRILFVGEPGETAEEADARAEVAREVFAEMMDQGANDEIARLNAAYAARLLRAMSRRTRTYRGTRGVSRVGAAA